MRDLGLNTFTLEGEECLWPPLSRHVYEASPAELTQDPALLDWLADRRYAFLFEVGRFHGAPLRWAFVEPKDELEFLLRWSDQIA